jgi:xanthine dehydrogenase small subunit
MAATPARALKCEAALEGLAWESETVESACTALSTDFSPISDFRASGDYRNRVAANLVRRVFAETNDPATPTDVMAL